MAKYREVERRLESLSDISDIVRSMKALAYLETQKLSRFLESEKRVLHCIEQAARDFGAYYPLVHQVPDTARRAYLLIGSERGFCADFNETLVREIQETLPKGGASGSTVIAVGHKLCTRLEEERSDAVLLGGPVVAEEVAVVLNAILERIAVLQERHGALRLIALHHDAEKPGEVQQRVILPPFEEFESQAEPYPFPPALNLRPDAFLGELIDHYLFALLHEIFSTSLLAENRLRIQHLEGALERQEKQVRDLAMQRNVLRQEEITQEIEIILLSTRRADPPAFAHPRNSTSR